MSATRRIDAAAGWREATAIRQEWLSHGLSTEPADRPATEKALTAIYAQASRRRPRFVWVPSPRAAIPLIAGLPTLNDLYEAIRNPRPKDPPPASSDVAVVAARLRAGLSAAVHHPDPEFTTVLRPAPPYDRLSRENRGRQGGRDDPGRRKPREEPWPEMPPDRALEAGMPLGVLLHQGIRRALHRSLADGIRVPIRDALAPQPVCWYGQHDASWIAYYDTLHRLGLATYAPSDLEQLDTWAALARSCGWWWPAEDTCVIADRPESLTTTPVPATHHNELTLRPGTLRYRDGWHPPTP